MEVKVVANKQEQDDALTVRHAVFVQEQQVPVTLEIDEYEGEATHFVVYDAGNPIGAGRMRLSEGYMKVERICVLADWRNAGVGQLLMQKIEQEAQKTGVTQLKLNSQTHAVPFYARLGYETVSDEFLDAGIPHVTMIKTT